MSLNEKIIYTVNRVSIVWAIMIGFVTLGTAMFLPVWCLILLIPFGIISYMEMITVAATILSRTVSEEELTAVEEEQALRDIKEQLAIQLMRAAGLTDVMAVEKMGPIMGNYKDKPIYEYVIVKSPGSKKSEKFLYHSPAILKNGMPEIPVLDGMIFCHVDGILYSKLQPV